MISRDFEGVYGASGRDGFKMDLLGPLARLGNLETREASAGEKVNISFCSANAILILRGVDDSEDGHSFSLSCLALGGVGIGNDDDEAKGRESIVEKSLDCSSEDGSGMWWASSRMEDKVSEEATRTLVAAITKPIMSSEFGHVWLAYASETDASRRVHLSIFTSFHS